MSPTSSSEASGWSDDRVTLLSKLWRDGLSASQIARQLGGVTRNAVIGKVHRLGLSGRRAPSAPRTIAPRPMRPRPPRRAAPSRLAKAFRPDMAVAPAAPEGPGLVDNLIHLAAHACKWPIGDPKTPGFSFCGRRADGRYCAAHAAQAVRPGTAWRADRDPIVRRALAGLV
ncbi:GcrA family cell cycle regulator [uncultured Phenylobacterium sp.]|uniref:GcrA family cell cycle regulator n=1 Tax=uncultured Phenylobacterium sp. TaxID=349273 RepID=UPI0025CC4CDA|nr:GcrA family cell cycle regulator [uncultured Phenylobacterium sp.]